MAIAVVAVIATITVAFPLAEAAREVLRYLSRGSQPAPTTLPSPAAGLIPLLISTVAWAGLIALLATALAWPAAWALRRPGRTGRRRILQSLTLVPLLLPNYLAYAGWGLVRAPDGPIAFGQWRLGDWLGRQPPWVSIMVGTQLAVFGLALWAWPLAGIILTGAARRIPDSILETMRLDSSPGRTRFRAAAARAVAIVSMMRGGILTAIAVIALVMAGSAVPLHLAQVETYAIVIWRDLQLTTDPASVWIRAWPLLVLAIAAAWFITSRLARPPTDPNQPDVASSPQSGSRAGSRWTLGAAALVWSASLVIPFILFTLSLREHPKPLALHRMARLIASFWQLSAGAVASSLSIAAGTAAGAFVIAFAVWAAVGIVPSKSGPPRLRCHNGVAHRAILALTAILLAAGLTPGVLIGSATQAAWNSFDAMRWVGDTPLIVILGHLARFGFLAAIIGWWCAATEPRAERDLRLLDGADTLGGWFSTRVFNRTGGAGAIIGAALAVGLLSFHEIEATVILQPPGVESFARQVLENLHFARDDRIAAAAVSLLAVGITTACAAGYLVLPAARIVQSGRSADPAGT